MGGGACEAAGELSGGIILTRIPVDGIFNSVDICVYNIITDNNIIFTLNIEQYYNNDISLLYIIIIQ
jgi:hypothetical protein